MEHIDVYRQAIETTFPQVQIVTMTPIQEGWGSFVLEINGAWIFRFPRRPEIVPGLRREIALLPDLARALSIAVPQYDYVWHGDEGCEGVCRWPFVGYRKIPGVPLRTDIATPALIAHLAATLGELHAFSVSRAAELGIPGGSAGEWREEYRESYVWVRQLVWPLLSPSEQAWGAALWTKFLTDDANFRFRPALVHRDLWGAHILCDPATGRVNGIIDWEDASIGDPAIDFAGLLMDHGMDFTRQVLARYPGPADETLWSRAEFYGWIGPVYEVRFGLETGQREHLERGLEELRTFLQNRDPDDTDEHSFKAFPS
jgi:aminoglycoside 2''-phosphotransferase